MSRQNHMTRSIPTNQERARTTTARGFDCRLDHSPRGAISVPLGSGHKCLLTEVNRSEHVGVFVGLGDVVAAVALAEVAVEVRLLGETLVFVMLCITFEGLLCCCLLGSQLGVAAQPRI